MATKKMRQWNGWDIVIYFVLITFCILALYPFLYTLAGSFNTGEDYSYGGVWLFPREFTLGHYQTGLGDNRFWTSFFNTILRTVIGTFASLVFTTFVAYAMSRPNLPYKTFFRTANLITMFFSGGLIPYYLMINFVGLYDSFLVYIIPSLYSVYNMIVVSNFFRGIPEELHESAIIDGATEFVIWWKFYLPLSKPVLATVGLWIAVGHWNSYMPTLLYTSRSESIWTLQYYLMRIIKDSSVPEGMPIELVTPQTLTFAAMVVSIVPIVCVYPSLQKYFAKGATVGSLKG